MTRRFLTSCFGAALILTGFLAPTLAADLGKAIPSDLSAQDSAGKARNFQNLVGKSGAVLVFYRSADW